MFWSLVRPDRILPPITRSAAVTTSLEADELAVGMITCEMFKGQDSWSSTPDQRRAPALRTAGRFIGLLWAGGGSKKKKVPIGRARRRLGFATYYIFPHRLRVEQYAGKSLKFHRDSAKNSPRRMPFQPEKTGVLEVCSLRFRHASKIRCRTRDGGHHRNHARGKTRAP